ncbi:MAG: FKBP-type peptidyl-prolyl cis-trans isomerase [Candidatus Nanopelagicales bacterium]
MKPVAVSAAAISALIVLAGCSSGSGQSTAPTPASASATFAVTDCGVSAGPEQVDAADGVAVTPDVSVLDTDVPLVYVREDSSPARELITSELRPGSGDTAALDDLITVEYCGVGLATGALFDSSWARGAPATFPLSQGSLIQGWVDGIPGMQVGERRVLVIPSDLAYGQNPPPGIEPGETLVFVVELLGVGQ